MEAMVPQPGRLILGLLIYMRLRILPEAKAMKEKGLINDTIMSL